MRFYILMALMLLSWNVYADMVVEPPELKDMIKRIEQRQLLTGRLPKEPAKIVYNENSAIFLQSSGEDVAITFNIKASTIEKHFRLKKSQDGYAFVMTLQNSGAPYEYQVKQIHGMDALFCFGRTENFVYTQEQDDRGLIELKEWIYAKAPNAKDGSQWAWQFKSEPWQWPISLEMGADGVSTVNRNMPFAGIPIEGKARSQFMLNMMVQFKADQPVKKYFPYSEKVVNMPPAQYITKEGVSHAADVQVHNMTIDDKSKPRQKVGLDFNRWDDHWTSIYTMRVTAKPESYPLLIE